MTTKRLIFTVTTGRSGTDYLARLMECVPGVTSEHEPRPHFVWAMREAQADPDVARRFLVEQKLPAIEGTRAPVYCETSHLVSKGFLEPLLELGHRPDLILLRRPHRQVAMSMFGLGTIPGRSPKALKWYLSPEDPGVLPLPGWDELHDYQLCYWYCLEVERRRIAYGKQFRALGSRVVDITLAELTTLAGFSRMLKELALPRVWWSAPQQMVRYFRRSRVRANTKTGSKRNVELPRPVEALEAEVDARIADAQRTAAGRVA